MKPNKKVLIFGSKGMLAHDIAKVFKRSGYSVVGVDKEDFDIAQEKNVKDQIYKTRPGLIINTAAIVNLDECENDPGRAVLVNAMGPLFISKYSLELDIPVVQISTIYVFSGEKRSGYSENDRPDPVNVYGIVKLAGELFAKLNPKSYIIRTNFLFGVNYNPNLSGSGNFVKRILNLSESGSVRVVTDQVASVTYTKDLAEKMLEIIESEKYGTYHITNSGSASLYKIAKEIIMVSGLKGVKILPAKLSDFRTAARRPRNTAVLNLQIRKNGMRPLRGWKEALSEYLKEIGYSK
ncbi:MAG: dTDP-4-dehydrorhamnose reductase [Candidatus Colwellbacteria bacterium]